MSKVDYIQTEGCTDTFLSEKLTWAFSTDYL